MDIRRKEKKAKSKVEKKEQRWKAAVVTLSDKGYAGEEWTASLRYVRRGRI